MTEPRIKNSHCSYCGTLFPKNLPWPRQCETCGNISYVNPAPVAVVLVPVDDGLLLVRRTIEPQKGKLSLPGGFMELAETWQEAMSRELREETGIEVAPDVLRLYDAHSAAEGYLLVFGLAPPRRSAELPPFTATNETSEIVLAHAPMPLAFSTHTETADRWWRERNQG